MKFPTGTRVRAVVDSESWVWTRFHERIGTVRVEHWGSPTMKMSGVQFDPPVPPNDTNDEGAWGVYDEFLVPYYNPEDPT